MILKKDNSSTSKDKPALDSSSESQEDVILNVGKSEFVEPVSVKQEMKTDVVVEVVHNLQMGQTEEQIEGKVSDLNLYDCK